MPINARITSGTAHRADTVDRGKLVHPYLRLGTRHRTVFDIVLAATDKGGATKPMIESATHLYRPQVLADLVNAKLVKAIGKRGQYKVYIADQSHTGVLIQKLTATVEFYETAEGDFFTVTKLNGRRAKLGKAKRFLGKKNVHFTVPLPLDEGVMDVLTDITPDPADNVDGS